MGMKDKRSSLKRDTLSQTTIEEASTTITIEGEKKTASFKELEAFRPRPWVRFWARMIDYTLFFSCTWLLADIFFGFSPLFAHSLFWMILIFLWAFIESAFLSAFGKTPGKWLLKTSVYLKDRQKLSYSEALNRSFSVWWLGFGAGVPVLSWITMIVAAVKLSNIGVCSWDKRCQTTVYHEKIGVFRTLSVIFYFLLYFWFTSWFQVHFFAYRYN